MAKKSPSKSTPKGRGKTRGVTVLFEHELHAAIREKPAEAARQISAIMARHDGQTLPAALEIGCGYRTLRRWIALLRKAGQTVEPVRGPGRAPTPTRTEQLHRKRTAG